LKLEEQNQEYKQQASQFPELIEAIERVTAEEERLKELVRQKIAEVDELRVRYQRIEASLRNNKTQQEQHIPALEGKLGQSNAENDRLNQALRARAGEIDSLRNRQMEMEREIRRLGEVEGQKNNIQTQMDGQVRQVSDLQGTVRQLEAKLRRLEEMEKELNNERGHK
jgi:chromosome segregation ATPase